MSFQMLSRTGEGATCRSAGGIELDRSSRHAQVSRHIGIPGSLYFHCYFLNTHMSVIHTFLV